MGLFGNRGKSKSRITLAIALPAGPQSQTEARLTHAVKEFLEKHESKLDGQLGLKVDPSFTEAVIDMTIIGESDVAIGVHDDFVEMLNRWGIQYRPS